MKTRGKVLLVLGLTLALGVGAAALIHAPQTRPFLERLHGGPHQGAAPVAGVPAGGAGESAAMTRAREGVAAIGRRWDAEAFGETVALYTAVHRDLDWPGLREPEAIRYGSDAQQNFELFVPEQGFSEPGPVFLFVHGNGLGASDWRIAASEGLLLTHAGRLAATMGGIGVLMNYRTGESADASSGAEDLRLMVEWLKENVASYDGDPNTIVVIGHSEGARLAATYLFDEASQPQSGPGLAAAVLSSGLFGDAAPDLAELIDAYRGETVPLALWSAEYDTPEIETAVEAVYGQLCEKLGECPWYEQLPGYNHMSQLFSFGTSDGAAMNAFIRFYHTVR